MNEGRKKERKARREGEREGGREAGRKTAQIYPKIVIDNTCRYSTLKEPEHDSSLFKCGLCIPTSLQEVWNNGWCAGRGRKPL